MYRWHVFEPWAEDVSLGITCRLGGMSAPPAAGLNLGRAVGGDEEVLRENRRAAGRLLGAHESAAWACCNQVHGTRIAGIPPSFSSEDSPIDASDGLSLSAGGVVAAVMLADCLPVAVYDPDRKAGVLCHAGWRGTLAGIAAEAVERLAAEGSDRNSLAAAAGPGIGPCCFTVGEDVAELFLRKGGLEDAVKKDGTGTFRIDLEAANLMILKAAGIREDRLGRGGFCTACRKDEFFSYRKEKGVTGRHAAVMTLL